LQHWIAVQTLTSPGKALLKYKILLPSVLTGLISLVTTEVTVANDPFWEALTSGKVDFSARYRYENVDNDLAPKEAHASTLRTALGYKTGIFYNFDARILLQDVRTVGANDYNDATGRPSAKIQYAVVADPTDTDYIEGYLGFSGVKNTYAKLGRQLITYRKAPFHRFIGNILWRQNWQNFDAMTLENTSMPDTTISYAYVWNVNRIFTDKAVASAAANFDSDSHFINVKYNGLGFTRLEAYTYLLDFNNAPQFSTDTFGLRADGAISLSQSLKALYAGEYAYQTDAGDNLSGFSGNYILGELGASITKPLNFIDAVTIKANYELLEGDGDVNTGINSFNTILGTNHAYQGWADRFVVTPDDGIQDYYLTGIIKTFGASFVAVYHDLNSDNLDYNYGEELDLMVTKKFLKHYLVGVKYSDYSADRNANNSGATAADVSKFWAWVQISF
jgi:hypothetical protein